MVGTQIILDLQVMDDISRKNEILKILNSYQESLYNVSVILFSNSIIIFK